MDRRAWPYRLSMTLMAVVVAAALTAGCATKNFVRQESQKTATTLSARIDDNEKSIQQNSEQIRASANQIGELASLNKQNVQRLEVLNGELQKADGKAVQARSAADQAQQSAAKANDQVVTLDSRFAGRNQYSVVAEKFIYFKVNSAELEKSFDSDLTEAAGMAKSNPNAIIAVEGRTDSSGDAEYNIRLGERRVDAVVRFLVVGQGVPMHQVHRMSFGAENPVADNGNKDGRAKNRCAVIRVLAPAGGKS
jgi:outer membrane protein OmpA-like peptidoglycan-associated protein